MSSCDLKFREVKGAAITEGMVRAYRTAQQQVPVRNQSEEEILRVSSAVMSPSGGTVTQKEEGTVSLSDGRKTAKCRFLVESSKMYLHGCFGPSAWIISTAIHYKHSKDDKSTCKIGRGFSSSVSELGGLVHPIGLVKGLKFGNFDGDPNNKADVGVELLDGTMVFYLRE